MSLFSLNIYIYMYVCRTKNLLIKTKSLDQSNNYIYKN